MGRDNTTSREVPVCGRSTHPAIGYGPRAQKSVVAATELLLVNRPAMLVSEQPRMWHHAAMKTNTIHYRHICSKMVCHAIICLIPHSYVLSITI